MVGLSTVFEWSPFCGNAVINQLRLVNACSSVNSCLRMKEESYQNLLLLNKSQEILVCSPLSEATGIQYPLQIAAPVVLLL